MNPSSRGLTGKRRSFSLHLTQEMSVPHRSTLKSKIKLRSRFINSHRSVNRDQKRPLRLSRQERDIGGEDSVLQRTDSLFVNDVEAVSISIKRYSCISLRFSNDAS